MKQLLILSGKGGTGKTTIASAFIKLAQAQACADCDVDAPNLHLILQRTEEPERYNYYGLSKAVIDSQLCIFCDLCRINCRFGAIQSGKAYTIDSFACEGCGVCVSVCPVQAIALQPAVAGERLFYSKQSIFSTARLQMGSGTSGKLVTEVKKQMQQSSITDGLAVIDGSPGIGCPVIASLSGVDMVLIVVEPSISGISDMERIIQTAQQFQIRIIVCINKYDINLENTKKIEKFCHDKVLCFAGRIPFDPEVIKAINLAQSIVDRDCPSSRAVKDVFAVVQRELENS